MLCFGKADDLRYVPAIFDDKGDLGLHLSSIQYKDSSKLNARIESSAALPFSRDDS
jgi:hypothetical protein